MIEEEKKETPNKSLVKDISTVLDYVQEDFGADIASLMSLSEHDEITFDLLGLLFPPKTLVFSKQNMLQEEQALEFKSGAYGQNQDGSRSFALTCQIITHDGQDFGYGEDCLSIREFEGSKKLPTLAAFPFSSHPESDKVKARLIKRGRRYIELLGQTCKDYEGTAVEEKYSFPEGSKKLRFNVSKTVNYVVHH